MEGPSTASPDVSAGSDSKTGAAYNERPTRARFKPLRILLNRPLPQAVREKVALRRAHYLAASAAAAAPGSVTGPRMHSFGRRMSAARSRTRSCREEGQSLLLLAGRGLYGHRRNWQFTSSATARSSASRSGAPRRPTRASSNGVLSRKSSTSSEVANARGLAR